MNIKGERCVYVLVVKGLVQGSTLKVTDHSKMKFFVGHQLPPISTRLFLLYNMHL